MLDQKTQDEVQEMRKLGVPLSVIAKTLNIPLSSIQNFKHEKAKSND